MALSPDVVATEANAWLWYPPEAEVVDIDDFLLVRWPTYFTEPPGLLRFTPSAAIEPAFSAALAQVATWGFDSVIAWVKLNAPAGFEDLLRPRGELDETLDVFALDLRDGVPALDAPDFTLRWRDDLSTSRDFIAVGLAAFEDGELPDDGTLLREAVEAEADRRAGRGLHVLVYDGDRAIGAAGLTMAGTTARLWGGGVLPDSRGRGAYRALLAARLAYAVEHGATMALVKGRVESSGPILRRNGFLVYGQERSYRVPV